MSKVSEGYKSFWILWLTVALLIFTVLSTTLVISLWRIGDKMETRDPFAHLYGESIDGELEESVKP